MRINYDINQSVYPGSGIGICEAQLAERLAKRPDIECVFLNNLKRNPRYNRPFATPYKRKTSLIPYDLMYGLGFPGSYETLMGSSSDVNVFGSYRLPKVAFKSPCVATIYDLILLKAGTNPEMLDKHMRVLRRTSSECVGILTVSESSREDIIDTFGLDPVRVGVISCSINDSFGEVIHGFDSVSPKYCLPEKYFLYLGTYRAHKNIESLIRAYSLLPDDISREFGLAISCDTPVLRALADRLGIDDRVVFTGFIDDVDKATVYHYATAVVYPSLYEGFGLPVLEAMASGAPVITSNVSSLPEVAGGAALLVNPLDCEELASAMASIAENDMVASDLVQRGRENVKRYSWDATADKFVSFLNKWVV